MTKVRLCVTGFLLWAAALITLPALAQAPAAPAHDPRVPKIINALSQAKTIRATALSPDGKQIVWEAGGRGGSEIELALLGHPDSAKRITACGSGDRGQESNAVFSPDSRELAFFSECTSDHKTAVFLADVAGGSAPHRLAELDGFAKQMQWSPDGKRLSFLYVEGASRPSGALAAEKPQTGVIGMEGLEVQRVAAVDASSGQLTQITPAKLHVFEFDWSPDSSKLAYVAAPPPGENNWWVAKLYTQPVGGDPMAILDPPTVSGSLHGLQIAVPRWSPDGTQIGFIGGLMSDQGSTGGDLYVMPAAGGEPKDVTPGITATPAWLRWKSSDEIQFTEIASGASELAHISVSKPSQDYDRGVDFVLPESIGSGGLQMSISFAEDGTAAMIRNSFASAPEVWTWTPTANAEGRHFTRITSLNDGLKPAWGLAEPWQWTNEGYRVDGWLLLPAHYDSAKKYPLIVEVHGGPSSAVLPRWPGVGYGPVPFSALDYFVLMPNPRGSYGEGEKFTQANRKDFGYGDLRDILAGVDAVEKKYPIDDHRVGLTGWSYGGFMTMFAVTQTHRFRAAVAGAGISDWQSYYGENQIDQWMIPFFGASVYDDPAVYAKMSAINYIKNVTTPVLEVVGERDGECPAPQSFEFWHALRDLDKTTELVVYPDEGHGFVNPDHRRDVLERALGWFEEYMP
jgi:dipeptidyl aminopeptidase/acylaminoacyl peptidase